ncbi:MULTISPECIES: response regulator transcription factor [unclassified Streptomyces]|uniref:response regulator n=1 Tax=unclassified Streptomyces TaxID=2593676 RepID=UPI000DC75DAF|nr:MULTISPECIES: response regulator transcription factor [unclassified Streptomyces]AWZ07978.1 DNA-binding response regulator [Streptomyces sp. ICC4]AWZ15721.1 DNA-binding response regulator [Streptomyces sp. ICC1]
MIRVLIADDEALIRSGLELILGLQDDMDVVGAVEDGAAALASAREHAPDVVLLDIRMPGTDGLAATAAITALPSPPAVIILTTFTADDYIDEALRAGAAGFLLKDTPPKDLVEGIRAVARGHAILSPAVTRFVIDSRHGTEPAAEHPPQHAKELARLTGREQQILDLLAYGMPNAEIAATLHMSEGTVKGHVSRMMAKLGATNRVQAARIAYEAGHPHHRPDRPTPR